MRGRGGGGTIVPPPPPATLVHIINTYIHSDPSFHMNSGPLICIRIVKVHYAYICVTISYVSLAREVTSLV